MDMEIGRVYFVADSFFQMVNDEHLKINYQETKRPHYYSFHDKSTSLHWLVPCSSRVEKYKKIIGDRAMKGKTTLGIKIVKIQGVQEALLFQDAFPITEKYIEKPYIRGGQPYRIADVKIITELEHTAKRVVTLLRQDFKFTPHQPDAMRIEKLMLAELAEKHLKQ